MRTLTFSHFCIVYYGYCSIYDKKYVFEILWAFIGVLLKRRFASHVGSQENPWTIQTRSNTGQYRLVFRTEWDMVYLPFLELIEQKTKIFCWKVILPANPFSTRIPVYCDPHFLPECRQ